ncbi:hypothetical protein GCM10012275_64710 [Longimycelium tulufanense]|uniref:Uncharacterized protein n=1 Tax=Longimycelium tulufanense TaxID=907463 RepID=A0A8J3CLG8_9PSEU|nr:hypothetical protein [Longimycelium tulufanense]GGM84993.1 hypothetical protein GCM10012275_64710 [Longimycelium tulufanense]
MARQQPMQRPSPEAREFAAAELERLANTFAEYGPGSIMLLDDVAHILRNAAKNHRRKAQDRRGAR